MARKRRTLGDAIAEHIENRGYFVSDSVAYTLSIGFHLMAAPLVAPAKTPHAFQPKGMVIGEQRGLSLYNAPV